MTGLIGALFSPFVNLFRDHQVAKHKAAERKDRIEETKTLATIKRIEQGDNNATKLDEISLSNRGWKDEYLLIITTLPVMMAFVPEWVHYVDAGFKALENIPEYYWYALAMIYIDTFGFRHMLRRAFEIWLERQSKRMVI
ncbi:conserved hypothetical protein [Vibrio nigripulchritudo SFn27]|uniref:Uncharacterized protein n=1 Tax=Vibrio nigripulchritudo TaxID=28173 RepID=U4K2I1_9VIBR|nr:hypothetical protein [Vibrio nigripulchritudo]CCN85473.1 conserved hypothetical protein [Vibrio nigripulchritudo BLFn1]CCN89058.1 conserved hypothetical protein [Vibrio nigripulchritudo SFn27]CCN95442.1 conserved hypothetical protein [Vibrio nigripulchritudo ENn2]CCO43199.1 conserved hypothetical protein [Vibrio nigripulchritudo SFn135]CCO54515.1 conserved hypothetical protein [Vibrio nigripulchritudo Wn13]